MTRSVAIGGLVAALIASGIVYAAANLPWPNAIASLVAPVGRSPEAKTIQDWPICTTMTDMGSEADWAQLDPDFRVGKRALAAEDWNGAIAALELAAVRDPRNADIHNYIGYANRRLRQFGPAMGHYQRALTFNPRHRSAHEHLGELLLVLGEPEKAQEHLEALARICLIPCNELGDLERLIASYNAFVVH
jgi:Flp pilus assembly protein TadD